MYSICVLSRVQSELDEIVLSEKCRIVKARALNHPIGVAAIGQNAIERSRSLAKEPWDQYKNSDYTFPPFEPHLDFTRYRSDEYCSSYSSECILEAIIDCDNNDERTGVAHKTISLELKRAITALRLLGIQKFRACGPLTFYSDDSRGPHLGLHNDGFFSADAYTGEVENLKITADDAIQLKLLYSALDTKIGRDIEVALHNFNRAQTARQPNDQTISAVIGIESLYLPDRSQELTLRLALRLAAHQGNSPDERLQVFETMQELYNARSKLVHGGVADLRNFINKSKSFKDEWEIARASREMLRKGCALALTSAACDPAFSWKSAVSDLEKHLIKGDI